MKNTDKNLPAKIKTKKTPKPPKLMELKKLPSMFKKTYTEKQLEKKLLKKIYIEDDKAFIKSLFTPAGKNKKEVDLYSIKDETQILKKDGKRLAKISKDIKSQKSRVRLIPLATIAAFIAIIVILFNTFKNRVIRNAIINSCESIFQAKCDVDYVDFKLFSTSLRIGGIQIANKKEPMKNLIQFDKIVLDFDLLSLLKGCFVTDELSVTDIRTNTDRKTSGDISAKLARKKAQADNSAFMRTVKARSEASLNYMKDQFTGLFDEYNPVNVVQKCYDQMTCPAVAKETEETTKALIEKYKAKPDEIKARYEKAKETADNVAKIDLYSIKSNPLKIRDAIEKIDEANKEIQSLKKDTETLINDIQKDANTTKKLTDKIQTAIKHDSQLISDSINKYSNLNVANGKNFITSTLDGAGYQLLGKYYPYAKQLVSYLTQLKNSSANNKEKKPTEKERMNAKLGKRAPGRTVYFSKNPPKFWIKQINASGENFSFKGRDFSSDMDRANKPASGEFNITFKDIDHTGTLVVDTRSNTTNPLVLVNYLCDRLPLSVDSASYGAKDIPGVPSFNAKSKLDFALKLYENDGFEISGNGNFYDLNLTANSFEPDFVSKIYLSTLANINEMSFAANAGYTESNGLRLGFSSDIDKQFTKALQGEMRNQLSVLKKSAEEELNKRIAEITNGAVTNVGTFDDIFNSIKDFSGNTNALENKLNAKKKEAESYLTNKVEDAKTEAKKQAQNYLKSLF